MSLAERMREDALEAQKFSRKYLVLELDFSDASIQELEDSHVSTLEYAIPGGLSDENVDRISRIWGAYIGEALRQACGGEWVESTGRLALKGERATVYPQEQVRLRLTKGDEHNLHAFYDQSKRQL